MFLLLSYYFSGFQEIWVSFPVKNNLFVDQKCHGYDLNCRFT